MLLPMTLSVAVFAVMDRVARVMREPTPMVISRGASGAHALQAQRGVDDPPELVGVGGIGGVAGALQALRELARVAAALDHLGVARAVLEQAGPVLEGLLVGGVGAEVGRDLLRLAVDHLGGGHAGGGALPVRAGLDAEEVEGAAAVSRADLLAAPAGLQRRLGEDEVGGDAGLRRRGLGGGAVAAHEVERGVAGGCGLGGRA